MSTRVESTESQILPNFYRLGIAAEKMFFTRKPDLYGGLVLGAHVLAYYKSSLEAFLARLGKPFFIDPVTYIFARPIDLMLREEGDVKRSFTKLLSLYGSQLAEIILEQVRALSPEDFFTKGSWNDSLIEDLCRNVIAFQRKFAVKEKMPTLEWLMGLAEQEIVLKQPVLLSLVAPYFYAESRVDKWYRISLELARRAAQMESRVDVYPVICLSKRVLLFDEVVREVVEDYKGFNGVLIWISDLQDDRDGVAYLKGVAKFVKAFAEMKRAVYSLYGGYFFSLLTKIGLTGFSSSICYGESKHVDSRATREGFPYRYYVQSLRTKVPEIDARAYYATHIQDLCRCPVCTEVVNRIRSEGIDDSQPSLFVDGIFRLLGDEAAKQHFLECRFTELQDIAKNRLEDILYEIDKAYKEHESLGKEYGKNLDPSHLRNWVEALRSFV